MIDTELPPVIPDPIPWNSETLDISIRRDGTVTYHFTIQGRYAAQLIDYIPSKYLEAPRNIPADMFEGVDLPTIIQSVTVESYGDLTFDLVHYKGLRA